MHDLAMQRTLVNIRGMSQGEKPFEGYKVTVCFGINGAGGARSTSNSLRAAVADTHAGDADLDKEVNP